MCTEPLKVINQGKPLPGAYHQSLPRVDTSNLTGGYVKKTKQNTDKVKIKYKEPIVLERSAKLNLAPDRGDKGDGGDGGSRDEGDDRGDRVTG